MDVAIGKCLDGFERAENRNQLKLEEQKKTFESKCGRMQERIEELVQNES
jgi:hypothetical protein